MATHSIIVAWRIPWTEEPGGLQSGSAAAMSLGTAEPASETVSAEGGSGGHLGVGCIDFFFPTWKGLASVTRQQQLAF